MPAQADVAELADAQASGACGGNPVEVQLLSSAVADLGKNLSSNTWVKKRNFYRHAEKKSLHCLFGWKSSAGTKCRPNCNCFNNKVLWTVIIDGGF